MDKKDCLSRRASGSCRHRRHPDVFKAAPALGPFGADLSLCLPNYTFKRCQVSGRLSKCQSKHWKSFFFFLKSGKDCGENSFLKKKAVVSAWLFLFKIIS